MCMSSLGFQYNVTPETKATLRVRLELGSDLYPGEYGRRQSGPSFTAVRNVEGRKRCSLPAAFRANHAYLEAVRYPEYQRARKVAGREGQAQFTLKASCVAPLCRSGRESSH